MARVIEIALLEGVEGKTRAQQIERLKEWKKHFLSQGADKIVVYDAMEAWQKTPTLKFNSYGVTFELEGL